MERTPYVCTIARVKRARIDNVIFSGDDSVVGEAQGSREPEMRVRDTVPLRARLPVRVRGHGVSARCGASTSDSCTCKRYVRALYNVRVACHRTLGLVTNVRALSLSVSRASNGISLSIFFRVPSTGSTWSYATSNNSTLKSTWYRKARSRPTIRKSSARPT